MKVWVIGNGQSRRNFDLDAVTDYKIGCNAVHRDFFCDAFVAVDRRMVDEIITNQSIPVNEVYTRSMWIDNYTDQRVKHLPELPFTGPNKADQALHWNSGPYALVLAGLMGPTEIHMLGFDLWGIGSLVNNIYKDTANYASQTSPKVTPDFWIYQLPKVFNYFSDINFIQHQRQDWKIPDSWLAIKNLTFVYDIV